MNEETKELLNIKLLFEYYKNKNILDRYYALFDSGRLVIDNECMNILEKPNEKLYITPYKKYKKLKQENEKLNKIIDELEKTVEDFITNHTEQYLDWKYDEKIYNAETNVLSKLHDKIFDKLTELKKEVE